uniref:Astacin-like metalloprotease toxin 2 n=1 Tax=Loxosceles intermedia TaxID=58218 RepID=VMPA2_LOXIN|nr:RecName: Full=Astacin-like metalloprotease toxin 2; AltName: Full=Loxosceles astacin-like protease 2; Short=LALP2; Flags: Precursor [Loxosceles intermedia]ACV52010.1 astacin-like metalloprotease toxin 2 precursor [Loxosceles intermedia]
MIPDVGFLVLLTGALFICIKAAPATTDVDPTFEGRIVMEGDILIREEQLTERNAIALENMRWPDATIVYKLTGWYALFPGDIKKAMRHIEENTCIKFKARSNEEGYVKIYKGEKESCFADIGYFASEQRLSLGSGCKIFGRILHEMGHTIGLFHEHTRPDRDNYITVHEDNIRPGSKRNYRKTPSYMTRVIGPFDYDSIMIYGETAGSRDPMHLKSMEANKPGVTLISSRYKDRLTDLDIKKINTLYNCPGKEKFS